MKAFVYRHIFWQLIGVVLVSGAAACTTTKTIVVTPTAKNGEPASSLSPAIDATTEAYLEKARQLIDQVKGSNPSMLDVLTSPDPSDPDWIQKASFYPLGYTVIAENWRRLDPPEAYRTKHEAVQRAVDMLDAAAQELTAGEVRKAAVDFVVAQSLYDSAAEDLLGP
jgi:hypothetical protein